MNMVENLPLWVAIPVAILVVIGSTLTLIGALGLLRMPSFYDRLHTPSLCASWGTGTIVLASMLYFSVGLERVQIHELIIGVFIMVTIPATTMILGRAALHRDMADGLIDNPGPRVTTKAPDIVPEQDEKP